MLVAALPHPVRKGCAFPFRLLPFSRRGSASPRSW